MNHTPYAKQFYHCMPYIKTTTIKVEIHSSLICLSHLILDPTAIFKLLIQMEAMQRPAATKVYQDFVPASEIVEEPQCNTLVLYLPGEPCFRIIQLNTRHFVKDFVPNFVPEAFSVIYIIFAFYGITQLRTCFIHSSCNTGFMFVV